LLERNREGGNKLSEALHNAMNSVIHCKRCRNFSESDICALCTNERRDQDILCIVENPADVLVIEQTHNYRGLYFVLMGHLSPLDGIGPDDLGIELLKERLQHENFSEIILATNPTVEGEATAHYVAKLCRTYDIKTTQIAHGIPLGGELEFVDSNTLSRAFRRREELV
jgi:recombination protein RecR